MRGAAVCMAAGSPLLSKGDFGATLYVIVDGRVH